MCCYFQLVKQYKELACLHACFPLSQFRSFKSVPICVLYFGSMVSCNCSPCWCLCTITHTHIGALLLCLVKPISLPFSLLLFLCSLVCAWLERILQCKMSESNTVTLEGCTFMHAHEVKYMTCMEGGEKCHFGWLLDLFKVMKKY